MADGPSHQSPVFARNRTACGFCLRAIAFLSLGLISTLLASDQPAPLVVTEETAFTFYRGFARLTKQPHLVAPLTATLCVSPSPELIKREQEVTGPHYQARVHIYANPPANDALVHRLTVFPAGAVIVKEKLAVDGTVSGVGGMIKHTAGFDVQNNDWEYFYSDRTAGFSIGKLENCAACHAGAKATDYVFGAWKRVNW